MAEDAAVCDPGSVPDSNTPRHDSGVIIGEDNLQEQQDEVLAIQSIYEGEEKVELDVLREPDESGHGFFQMQIKIPVITPENCQVDLMLPLSADSSVIEEGGTQGAEGGQPKEEGVESVPEGVTGQEQGARAQTPPPMVGKGVALQRSLSGQRWTGSFKIKYLCPMTLHLTLPPTYPSHDPPAFALSCVWLQHRQIAALCKQLDKQWEANPNMPVIFSWVDWLETEALSFLGLTNSFVLMPENKEERKNNEDDGRVLSESWDLGEAVHTMLQYSEQKEAVEFCKGMQECCLCLDEKPGTQFFRLVPCKHHFCFDCLATHCNLHVMEGTVQLLTCPASECEVMLSPDILQSVLSPEAFIRWETISLQKSLDEMDDVVYCPRCQAVVIREQDMTLNLGYCLACCFSFCTECEQPWHQGTACQSELDRLEEKAGRIQSKDNLAKKRFDEMLEQAKEKQKSLLMIESKTRTCPHCRIPVEKIAGCNKMTCRCGKSFCWLCGMKIVGYNHFQNTRCLPFVDRQAMLMQQNTQMHVPAGLLWMRAQAEVLGNPRNREIRCAQCKQPLVKVDNSNHIRCWNCKTQVCFVCRTRITGSASQHFGPGLCPQHS